MSDSDGSNVEEQPRKKAKSKKQKLTEEELQELELLEKKILGKDKGLLKVLEEETRDVSAEETSEFSSSTRKPKPAWSDEDDSTIRIPRKLRKYATVQTEDKYENLLRRKFEETIGVPNWAKKHTYGESSTDDDLERCGNMLETRNKLTRGTLKIQKMQDLNIETKKEGPRINAVEFHPSSTVAFVAGESGVLSIFQVDGTTNSKLDTVSFRGFCIECAHFTTNGQQIVVGNRKAPYFFYYDLIKNQTVQVPFNSDRRLMNMSKFRMSPNGKIIAICGAYGNIHLMDQTTKTCNSLIKMNSDVVDISFNHDGSGLFSFSENGEVYEWDTKMTKNSVEPPRCVQRMFDDGCVKGTSIILSPNSQILATGSQSGIVNLYEMPISKRNMSPVKIVKNLVTPITAMAFNHSSEILAIASREKHNAVRLVHFPSMTAYSNFPGFTEVGQPRTLSFSPLSGFFAIGNGQNKVLLYRLKHYKNY